MNLAYEEAFKNCKKNCKEGGPFGAVIVKNNKIISKARNKVIKNNDPTAHAEINAIRLACKKLKTYDLSGCTLYTTAYPCPMCFSAIIWANIKDIYYGNTKEETDDIGFRDEHIYELIKSDFKGLNVNQLDHDMTIKLFKEFNKKKNLYWNSFLFYIKNYI